MTAAFKLGIALVATDHFSGALGSLSTKLSKLEGYTNRIGERARGLITPMNLAVVGSITSIMRATAETESATIQLQNTMMGTGGVVSSYFGEVAAKAEQLGAKLPGTTADFYKMASAMRALGVGDASLLSVFSCNLPRPLHDKLLIKQM